jgi:hypothetical protein
MTSVEPGGLLLSSQEPPLIYFLKQLSVIYILTLYFFKICFNIFHPFSFSILGCCSFLMCTCRLNFFAEVDSTVEVPEKRSFVV